MTRFALTTFLIAGWMLSAAISYAALMFLLNIWNW
jgi:hypothetical protein